MLIFTLTMKSLFPLVFIVFLSSRCRCVTVRDYDESYTYTESDLVKPEALNEEEQLRYYKRSGGVSPQADQYTTKELNQDTDYYPSQYSLGPIPENHPNPQRNYEQQITKRIGTVPAKKPYVEQYLKEVAPTTKTAYNQRLGNYQRASGQARRGNKERIEETQSIQRHSPFQYVLQSDLQQKAQPQIQYEIPTFKPSQTQQIGELQPQSVDLTLYQNALLAHQKVLETQQNQDVASTSSIHMTHTIPKKLTRKLVKPKQSPTNEDVEYLARFQQYQQKQPQVYEQQQPAEVRYMTRLQYTNDERPYQPAQETSAYQGEKVVYQQPKEYQQDVVQTVPNRQVKKSGRPIKYRPEFQIITPEIRGQSPEAGLEYQTLTKPKNLAQVQFQQPAALRQVPKYLPEPSIQHSRPAAQEELKYKQINNQAQSPEALISYEAAIAKLYTQQLTKSSQQQPKQESRYQEQDVEEPQPERFTFQLEDGVSQQKQHPEYFRPEQPSGHQQAGNDASIIYRQVPQRSNVKYYRNLGRPIPYPNYE